MSAVARPLISRDEYLRQERLAAVRSEYHHGRMVAMAGASLDHNRTLTNISTSLDNQLRTRACNNYSSDMRVSVRGGERYLYPDVVVTCGEEVFEDDEHDNLVNPLVIIEVLSPSTEAHDRGEKFLHYQTIPSLQEYVLITQAPRRFEVFRKQGDGSWRYESWAFSRPPLVLQAIECTLEPEDVYSKLEEEVA